MSKNTKVPVINSHAKGEYTTDTVSNIIAWENGELTEEEEISFFQSIIDSGLVWQLQGSYGRYAHILIESGQCTLKQAN